MNIVNRAYGHDAQRILGNGTSRLVYQSYQEIDVQ